MKLTHLDKFFAFHISGLIDALEEGNYNVAMMHLLHLQKIIHYAARYNASLN
jgi:hypothetical protein